MHIRTVIDYNTVCILYLAEVYARRELCQRSIPSMCRCHDGKRQFVCKSINEYMHVIAPSTMVSIKDAKNQRSDINVEGTIKSKSEPRTVKTRYGETEVCDAYLEDEVGDRIRLSLWGNDIEKIKEGDKVSIQGGYTTTFRNEVQLNIPKKTGKLEVIG